MSSIKLLSPEIEIRDLQIFVLRINGTDTGFIDTAPNAKIAIEALARKEVDKYKDTENIKVFMRPIDNNKIIIYKQVTGILYNSKMIKESIIDFIPINKLKLL